MEKKHQKKLFCQNPFFSLENILQRVVCCCILYFVCGDLIMFFSKKVKIMSDGLNNNEYTSDKRERLPFINYILSHRNSERDNSSEL